MFKLSVFDLLTFTLYNFIYHCFVLFEQHLQIFVHFFVIPFYALVLDHAYHSNTC